MHKLGPSCNSSTMLDTKLQPLAENLQRISTCDVLIAFKHFLNTVKIRRSVLIEDRKSGLPSKNLISAGLLSTNCITIAASTLSQLWEHKKRCFQQEHEVLLRQKKCHNSKTSKTLWFESKQAKPFHWEIKKKKSMNELNKIFMLVKIFASIRDLLPLNTDLFRLINLFYSKQVQFVIRFKRIW